MASPAWPRRVLVGLLAASVVLGGVAGVVDGASPSAATPALQVDGPTPMENATRHEDPREARGDGDLVSVRDWLAGRLAVKLEDCMVAVGAGRTDVCALDDEYPDWLSLYVDVVDETADRSDDGLGEPFERAGEDAEDFATAVEEFRATYSEYREAREAGDEARARRLARELQGDGAAVEAQGAALDDLFIELESGAGVDLAEARVALNDSRSNVTALVADVEREQFVATRLSVRVEPRAISFLEPGTVTGRLTTANGSALADREIDLEVGERTLTTRTDAEGRFSLAYRPVTLPVATGALAVHYVPRPASVYLASEASAPVSVAPVTPTVRVRGRPGAVSFADAVTVSGRVSAQGIGAPGVPVIVTIDGRRVASTRTNASGGFAADVPIAAVDGPGPVEVRATVALEASALAAASGTTEVRVDTTATTLTLDASATGPSSLDIEGRLETAAGEAVPGQPVTVRLKGTPVESLRTRDDGRVAGTVTVPASLAESTSVVAVELAYAATGTNLEASSARQVAVLPARAGGAGERGYFGRPVDALPGSPPRWQVGVVVGLLALLVVGILLTRWARGRHGPTPAQQGEPEAPVVDQPSPAASTDVIDLARERLADDADGAVLLAYAAARDALAGRVGEPGRAAATHWEFLAACERDGVDDATLEEFAALTEAFERAAFAPKAISTADAEGALRSAASLL